MKTHVGTIISAVTFIALILVAFTGGGTFPG